MHDLDQLIAKLEALSLKGTVNADLINEVNDCLNGLQVARNSKIPEDGEGSNLFVALMYQNLLLERRLRAIEVTL